MQSLSLTQLSVLLGLACVIPGLVGVLRPKSLAGMLRKFPRQTPVGYVLMLAATAWFLKILHGESISDFAHFKPVFYALFAAVGIGTCLFVSDFLPVRGLAVLLLLLGKLMVDTGRPFLDITSWVLIIQAWAYLWVVAGMWFTVSPWRLRDLLDWATASESRLRALSGLRLAFGVLLLGLAFTVFRQAEKRLHELERIDPAQARQSAPWVGAQS